MKRTIAIFLLASPFGQFLQAQQQREASLAQTEEWINQTFTVDLNASRASCNEFDPDKPGSEYGTGFYCLYEKYSLDLKGCRATLSISHSHRTHTLALTDQEDEKDSTMLSFNLRDIDPSTIRTGETTGSFGPLRGKTFHDNVPSVRVDFSTTNDADTMTLIYPHGHEPTTQYKKHKCCDSSGSGIDMKPEYAPRFVKAFRHAVELCGGKTSTF
jgi:hypothetical protein